MKIRLLTALALLPFLGFSQWQIDSLGYTYYINFDQTAADVNNGSFDGTGFDPLPSPGQLDSDAWRYAGMTTPPSSTFGDTADSGDAAKGLYDGTTGAAAGPSPQHGIYSFKTNNTGSSADYALGTFIQGPTTITLRVRNTTDTAINIVRLGFDAKFFNNRPDGTRLKFGYSTDDVTYTDVATLEATSAETADAPAAWESKNRSTTLSNLNWVKNGFIYFQWSITEIGSAGYEDPVGIDNIVLQGFNAKYLFDGTEWVTPNNAPSGSDPDAVAFVMYGDSIARIPTSTSLSSIYIEPQARLDIGADLTVGNSAVLAAGSNGYSQVIGEILGTTRYQSYRTTTNGRWFNIAIPVQSTWDNVTGIPVQTTVDPNQTNLWYYDAADTSQNLSNGTWKHIADQSTAPTEGIGYQLYAGDGTYFGSGPFTMEVTGDLIDGTTLINVEGHAAERYNLIPNPYPSTVEWDSVFINNSEVGTTYYIQDGVPGTTRYREYAYGGSGSEIGGTSSIAPGQTFFITVDGTTDGTIEFRNSFRNLQGNTTLFKTTSVPGLIKLHTEEVATGYSDESEIRFSSLYSDNYAFREDGKNMMNTGYPNIYTHADGNDLVFNGLDNSFTNTKDVDLYFHGDHAGVYEMSISHDGLPAEWTVILEDKNTATFTNLRKSTYTYTHATGASADRFILHFNKTGAIGMEEMESSEVYSFVTGEILTVSLDNMKDARIRVYDISGKEMVNLSGQSDQANIDMSKWARGVYVISVSASGKQVHQNKVVH